MRLRSIALALVVVMAACSTFTGEDDAPTPPLPGPDADAAPETSTTNEAGVPDGANDGGGDAATFCSGPLGSSFVFCRDFEDGRDVGYGFQAVNGAPVVDTATASSPTHAMWSPTTGAWVRYGNTAAPVVRQIVRTALYLGTAPPGDGGDGRPVVLLRIVQGPGPAECVHEIFALRSSTRLDVRFPDDGGPSTEINDLGANLLDLRRWSVMEVVLDKDGASVLATVKLDGAEVLAKRKTGCRALSPNVQVFLGQVAGAAGEARFDDFGFGGY